MPGSIRDPYASRIGNWLRDRRQSAWVELELLRWYFTRKGRVTWPGMGEPFNGQQARIAAIRLIIDVFQPEIFVETGTFFGHTTAMLSEYGQPVHSTEIKCLFAHIARRRLRQYADTHVHRSSSVELIAKLQRSDRDKPLFAYLDAHWWSDDPPLAAEVAELARAWRDFVIVIDDFRVPGDPGYAYDTWGGRDLDESILPPLPDTRIAYPAIRSDEETGAAHGCVYLFRGAAAIRGLERACGAGLTREGGRAGT